ncbi:uncharacterized protein LOC124135313 isoform X2 [Haliotis rufescens]|uniref:uncharacterized protein LOC124135313 isoform X2 n=1 Tax=Haliotis rufescens TaxID=6454 RepID=UPI00201FA86E|nr:uncharacterized protein LOC124135313 isoform X2 [Haliotis rufescens]
MRCTKWSMRKLTAWILLGIFLFLVYKSAFFTVKRQNSPPEIEGPVSRKCSPGFFNSDGFIEIPSEKTLPKLSYEDLTCLYHRFVDNVGVLCRNIVRLGKLKDGGWEVCHDQQYRIPNNCLVYSAGINNDFSFDDAIAKQYGCKVHSFDPSVTLHKKGFRHVCGLLRR